jgi:acrylyl-CoA reductase (NADPH)
MQQTAVKETFKAFVIEETEGGSIKSSLSVLRADQLDAGDVTIKVAYSSVNYKDALAATGAGKIIRRFPCVGGVDLAGEVVHSLDPRFAPGDKVIATGFDIGVSHHGGYAEYARLPADWIVALPAGLTLLESMALGTAGFTAALGIVRMEANDLAPENGPVAVTGATGGVGSLAIDMLSNLGYEVVALTSKSTEDAYLTSLGAARVQSTSTIDLTRNKAMESAQWAGAIDNVGGPLLSWVIASMKRGGTVASIGNAASGELRSTVYPFILRGVSLVGVDSGYIAYPTRQRVWERLSADLKPRHLMEISKVIDLEALPACFEDFIQGRVKGRTVVRIGG